MEDRKREEASFHDRLRTDCLEQRWSVEAEDGVGDNAEWSNFRWYSVERRRLDHAYAWLGQHCPGRRVLDYCCGNGLEALCAADLGARQVIGIDISAQSVENCRRQAAARGLEGRVSFEVMDAEATRFPDAYFDVITEYGALHHLDLERALPELARILKPDGAMICTEALGHNPFIRLYRRATLHLRTAWEVEHIIRRREIRLMGRYFERVEPTFFHVATLAAVPFRRTAAFPRLLGALGILDRGFLAVPGLRWQAWQVVIVLSRPRTLAGAHP